MKMSRLVWIFPLLLLAACSKPSDSATGESDSSDAGDVVVYTAHDQIYSEPILNQFNDATGVTPKAAYDTEATKTVGLVNRLIAEKSNAQADVFWNNEIARTLQLKKEGVLAPYASPAAENIPETFKDPDGYWYGFGARARVLIYNTELVDQRDAPNSIYDLADEKWKGQAAIANPLFGTTSTHAAALFAEWGPEKAKAYYQSLLANDIQIVDGNAVVRDMVGAGQVKIGITDTDDAYSGKASGMPIEIIFPDQQTFGALLIPNTVSMIASGPNPEAGQKLVDYLLSPDVERSLAASRAAQIPLNPSVEMPDEIAYFRDVKHMEVDFEAVADYIKESATYIQEAFIK